MSEAPGELAESTARAKPDGQLLTESEMPDRGGHVSPTLPVAAIRLWVDEAGAEAVEEVREASLGLPGVSWPQPELCVVAPIVGDPAPFDMAVRVAQRISRVFQAKRASRGGLRMLILPLGARISAAGAEPAPTPLLKDLELQPPGLEPEMVHLTSYAAERLEIRRHLTDGETYEAPSGWRVPLLTAGGEALDRPPWRNPSLLGRALAFTPRPELSEQLRAHDGPVLRISGPMGSGKTRLVWEAMRDADVPCPWTTARPQRQQGTGIAALILHQLLSGASGFRVASDALEAVPGFGLSGPSSLLDPDLVPDELRSVDRMRSLVPRWLAQASRETGKTVHLACDGLENAATEDLQLLEALAETARETGEFRLVLIARSGCRWPMALAAFPELTVGPMTPEEFSSFSRAACSGLSLPKRVEQRFVEKTAGFPFALEEGLSALIHAKLIRQVYGNFFFSGSEDAPYQPSDRLVQHAFAEATRTGHRQELTEAALAGFALPESPGDDETGSTGGASEGTSAGWLRAAQTPWGAGTELACPAYGEALLRPFPRPELRRRRRTLGNRLWHLAPVGAWKIYGLLAGTPEALAPLLTTARQRKDHAPEAILEALKRELLRHRERGGGPKVELEILNLLLPLARRLGSLDDHAVLLPHALDLADGYPRRILAFAALKSEVEEQRGSLGEAEETLRDALRRSGSKDEPAGVVVLLQLGRLLLRQGRLSEARELLEGIATILDRSEASAPLASCRFYLGNIALRQNRLRDARELHQQALRMRRSLGLVRPIGASLAALGSTSLLLGLYEESLKHYQESERLFRQSDEQAEAAFALLGIGRVLGRLGDFTGAAAPLRKALEIKEGQGDRAGIAIARLEVADNYLGLKRLNTALSEARRAHFDLEMLPTAVEALGQAEQLLGRILVMQRNHEAALEHLSAAIERHRRNDALEDQAFDLAWFLHAAIELERRDEVEAKAAELDKLLRLDSHFERRGILFFHLVQALDWLGVEKELSLQYLKRSYEGVLAQAEALNPELRHRFLFQVPVHQDIITAATREGLT